MGGRGIWSYIRPHVERPLEGGGGGGGGAFFFFWGGGVVGGRRGCGVFRMFSENSFMVVLL